MKALIDFRAQISAISSSIQKSLGVPLKRLDVLLEIVHRGKSANS